MKKIELKAKRFAKSYLEHNLNGTQAALDNYNTDSRVVAKSIATENLSKPVFQKAIQEALESSELNSGERLNLLTRNAKQSANYSASNTAIDQASKIAGDYAPEKKESVTLHLTGKDIQLRASELLEELKTLE